MSFQDNFYAALLKLLHDQGVEADTVTGFNDRIEYGGYCETCSYEYVVCDIDYTLKGKGKTYTYDADFSTLLSSLT